MKSKKQVKADQGFTLIELLVVVAIISLLASLSLIAYQSTRQKSRNAKRLSDMTQMANAFEIYFANYKGYPSSTSDMVPTVIGTLPKAPLPPDGDCVDLYGNPVYEYNFYPSGTAYTAAGRTVYPEFFLFFCLGDKTGAFDPGTHYISQKGIR